MTREQAIEFLRDRPYKFAHLLGFTKLEEIHNEWIIEMVRGKTDQTLQASRGTYKTTCVSVALANTLILLPKKRNLFMRKTDTDVKEVIRQVQKILESDVAKVLTQAIYGVNLALPVKTATETSTNLITDIKGTNQLVGLGIGSSITGKHYDNIFTDDIVNINDRTSKAEREKTKIVYQELQNVKNRDGGRIFNTGTPWHQDDAFSIMPAPVKYDCYDERLRAILTPEEIARLKKDMLPSLFAANYELRFIASEDVIFADPQTGADAAKVMNGTMHLDSAFYGEDYTAWGIMTYIDGKYYLYGQMRRAHVEDCYKEIQADYERFLCTKLWNETNADKGMVGRDLKKKNIRVGLYHENMNKYLKIVTYLKAVWPDLVFVEGTDPEYIQQITDYFEDADHDDAPDNAACLARMFYKKASKDDYKPMWN